MECVHNCFRKMMVSKKFWIYHYIHLYECQSLNFAVVIYLKVNSESHVYSSYKRIDFNKPKQKISFR